MTTLYVVATPIGNLSDFSPRAVDTLRGVGRIFAEDTRTSKRLLDAHGIHTPMTSLHLFNEKEKCDQYAAMVLESGQDAALVTDAGTPAVSDPGYLFVASCVALGMPVMPIPGCCAAVAALSASGIDGREFQFYGFLPRQKGEAVRKLWDMRARGDTAIVYESPHRVLDLMAMIAEQMPDAKCSVSCDLTKLYERTLRGLVPEVLRQMRDNPKTEKGEYCLVLDLRDVPRREQRSESDVSLEALLVEQLLSGQDMRAAIETLKGQGARKNALYAAKLRLEALFSEYGH